MITKFLRVLFAGCACCVAAADDLSRELVLTRHEGAEPEDLAIVRWQKRAAPPQASAESYEQLAWAYVTKARCSLDSGYYKLAERTVTVIDDQFGPRPESQLLRGHVLHNLHRFRETEAIARDLVESRGAPVDWALLSDALIEQGKIGDGMNALQRFVDLKPGTEAYSRISHVRWLRGDLRGAMKALELAFRAAAPVDNETRAWLGVRLAGLYLESGDHERALAWTDRAIEWLPNYAPGLLARGRALVAEGRVRDALVSLRAAERLQPLPEYQWWLADVLRLSGNEAEAELTEKRLLQRGADLDPRTVAIFRATRGCDASTAVRLAQRELAEREDVFTHDACAWAGFAAGDLDVARREMDAALAAGTQDARLFLHAGEIALAHHDAAGANRHFSAARLLADTLTPSERAMLRARRAEASEPGMR